MIRILPFKLQRWICDTSGAATVEFALVAPIVLMLCYTSVEFARVDMIRNTMEIAAYEGAREGIIPGAKAGKCRAVARSKLRAVGITNAKIRITPSVIQPDTQMVRVKVRVPLDENGLVVSRFFHDKIMVKSCTLSREDQD